MYQFNQDDENKCGSVIIHEKKVLVDGLKEVSMLHFMKNSKNVIPKWVFDDENHLYTHNTNSKRIYFLELLFAVPFKLHEWRFKNGNNLDLRRDNILCTKKLVTDFTKYQVPDHYEILERFEGHVATGGNGAGSVFNPYWLVKNKNEKDEPRHYIIHCSDNVYCKFSEESLPFVLEFDSENKFPTWYKTNNYIATNVNRNVGERQLIYMHSYLLRCQYAQENKEWDDSKIVVHKNKDISDNRLPNLEAVTHAERTKVDKRKRNHNACPLPEGLGQQDLPKYIVYQKEVLNHTTGRFREGFRIEGHPKLEKAWIGTKSAKVTIQDKLKSAKEKLAEVDRNAN